MRDVSSIRGLFGLGSRDQWIGQTLWGNTGVECECMRKGGARMYLFRNCIGLEYEDRQAPDCFRFDAVHLEPSWKAYIQKNSFAVVPLCYAEVRVIPHDTTRTPSAFVFKSNQILGWEASRAIQFCWQAVNNELSERNHVAVSCNRFADVVSVHAKLPIKEACSMVWTDEHRRGRKVVGELRLETDGVLRFNAASKAIENCAFMWRLDKLRMVRRASSVGGLAEQLEIIALQEDDHATRTYAFSGFSDFKSVEPVVVRAWCLNCNSDVNYKLNSGLLPTGTSTPLGGRAGSLSTPSFRDSSLSPRGGGTEHLVPEVPSPHRKKKHSAFISQIKELPDKVCFSVDEVHKLLRTFQLMDTDRNGKLCKNEWVHSLGPVFRHTQVPHAVFSVFDTDCDGVITFPEFLFGCRILHLGSLEDRMQYQYRIFDPTGQGWMSEQQFVTVAQTLQEAVGLRSPAGLTLPQYCKQLFQEMDRNGDNTVDILEFKDAIQSNAAFSEAFKGLAEARVKSVERARLQMGKPVWFGDPQWLQCTAILLGIKLAQDKRESLRHERGTLTPPSKAALFKHMAFTEKVTWELSSHHEVADPVVKKPAPGGPLSASGVEAAGAEPAGEERSGGGGKRGAPSLVAYESYFTDYSPQVFASIQQKFGVTAEEYKMSLGIAQLHSSMLVGALSNLNTMSSSGKSGAFFFASHDGKFILKTIDKNEGKILRRVLPAYYDHIMEYPDTLLTRYFGLHALSYGSDKMYFLVMNNVMQPPEHLPIQISYDLKGSTVNRTTPQDKRKDKVALKDLDFKRKLVLNTEDRRRLMTQIRADSALLQREQLNDYSLLVGIHCSDDAITENDSPSSPFWAAFNGGIASKDRKEVYYIGIIDLLTSFTSLLKKTEYSWKSVWYRNAKVSCVPPGDYRERFVQFSECIFPATVRETAPPPLAPSAEDSHDRRPAEFGPTPAMMQRRSLSPYATGGTVFDIISPPGSPLTEGPY